MANLLPNAAAILILLPLLSVLKAKAQINTACSSSVITSFTPCLNFVTGSSSTGSSPTEDCCNSLKSLMTDNVDCACLIVTGNVPVSIPFINASMAISLPQACKSSVPLQCKATGVPLPPPGPVLFGPTPAPSQALAPPPHTHSLIPAPAPAPAPHAHRHSPKPSKAAAAPPPVEIMGQAPPPEAAAAPPVFALGPSANPGIRPVFNPNSASSAPPALVSLFPRLSVIILAGIIAAVNHY